MQAAAADIRPSPKVSFSPAHVPRLDPNTRNRRGTLESFAWPSRARCACCGCACPTQAACQSRRRRAVAVLREEAPEQVLYHRLVAALPGEIVLAQVQLSRVLGVKKGFNFNAWHNRINRLSYDFVVCGK